MFTNATRDLDQLRQAIYGSAVINPAVAAPMTVNPLLHPAGDARPNSIAVEGGAFGDEGKGRIVDEVCTTLAASGKHLFVYRWNGGANAGHTVVVDSKKISLHQLPSGVLTENADVILGKGMVLHPGDLVTEIEEVKGRFGGFPAHLHMDEMAVLALDTHRAFEGALKKWEAGGLGSTGRGIAPAYADVLFRHPMRLRDLIASDWRERLGKHYDLYEAFLRGLGQELATSTVTALKKSAQPPTVGTKAEFLDRLAAQVSAIAPYIHSVYDLVRQGWHDLASAWVFEGAQAVGLDSRYGVYPDITASDPTFDGILPSTEGIVEAADVAVRAGAVKATYTSTVGTRRVPTMMENPLAQRIRDDAHEYGATTGRPRDIAYIDLPCLGFYARVSRMTHLILTHLDIAYTDVPIRVCTHYTDSRTGAPADYRPDQEFLNTVTPNYVDLPSWDGRAILNATDIAKLPTPALQYIDFLTQALATNALFGTTGPERDALISWLPA
ncbi:MAG: adenylosuccinate synthetase [Anaerolineae bacterium]|nr:adenylosuccinate synthetase [Anaerolineae bacterium]